MFKATIPQAKLKESVESIKAIAPEARFNIAPDGISVKAVDPANVGMVSLTLATDAFQSYEATDGVLGIELGKLSGVLEMADKDDNIDMELDEQSHKLVLRMRGIAYTMALIDPESVRKSPKVRAIDLPARIVIRGEAVKRAIKAAEKVSDYISIGVRKDVFFMEATGDSDTVKVEMKKEELIDLTPADVKSLFSLDYLLEMSKIMAKVDEVTIGLGKDYPLKVNFRIAEGHGEVGFMLAPRVEND